MDRTIDGSGASGDAHRGDDGSNKRTVIIEVADVEEAAAPLPTVSYRDAVSMIVAPLLSSRLHGARPSNVPIEACADESGRLVAVDGEHPGVAAVRLAFTDHRPLILSPDIVWMFIAQGFARHVNANAESLRRKLVAHQGQLDLEVWRDEFVYGSPDNDWPGVFDEFSGMIREHIGTNTHTLLEPRFSTTGPLEKAAAQVVLMGAFKTYFRYFVITVCGIPRVILEGTTEDWVDLAARVEGLGAFDLKWWTDALLPVLNKFVAAASGEVDAAFWNTIYAETNGSGGPYVSGWITSFFPYLMSGNRRESKRNWLFEDGDEWLRKIVAGNLVKRRISNGNIPNGDTKVPFVWKLMGVRKEMEFAAGFVGIQQDEQTLALRPAIGWAVYEPARVEAALDEAQPERRRPPAPQPTTSMPPACGETWVWKGLCPNCRAWIYGDETNSRLMHCAQALVQVSRR
jgi:hypothetical protein